ncbi:hypothetical protein LJ656_18420 [Paraburkholderia sp. MMS20-SJTR3]|uniref:Uncharacterized protein n=1 Tax=Paraburkholderia sejongensis TaxID=2886946 RepID=A0ABS8JY38_9BURK|nr:hypothetical protein [Paraburkholderia sp. MMS20-SJTR3]MCC8394569.1 hypothetical protein [Paraburkholderia sp. MMS20-SJTR3]
MAFYLSLLAMGLAGTTGAVALRVFAAAQAKQRGALRPLRVERAAGRTGRAGWRG